MTDALAEQEDSLVCPACGYDLRGRVQERCSECGAEIDAQSLKTSQIPWARRKEIGRVKAYFVTLWMVIIDDPRLRYEASRPQVLGDAKKFMRITGLLLAFALVGVSIWLMMRFGGFGFLAIQKPTLWGPPARVAPWVFDLAVPWSAVMAWGALPVMLVMLSFYLSGVHRRMFDVPGLPQRQRERGTAIGCYASAPLVLVVLLAVASFGMVKLMDRRVLHPESLRAWVGILLTLLAGILSLTMIRVVQWVMRVRHRGMETAFVAAPYLLGLWVLGVVAWLGIVPWCLGLVWIMIDSFLE